MLSQLQRDVWEAVDPGRLGWGSLVLMDLRVSCATCDTTVALDATLEPGSMSRLPEGVAAGVCGRCGEQYRARVVVERRSY